MPLFSVVVPIYKVEKYLEECIDSILSQTFTDFELILVDDGSPDKCGEICDKYAGQDSRISVIHKENGGSVSARRTGTEAAKAEYVFILDADDYIGSSLFAEMAKIIKDNDFPDIVAYNCVFLTNNTKVELKNSYSKGLYTHEKLNHVKENILYNKELPSLNLGGILHSVWSKVIKRNILLDVQAEIPREITKGDDLAVTVQAILKCDSLYFSDCAEYYYRNNESSIMNSFSPDEISKYEVLINFLFKCLGKKYENQIYVYTSFMIRHYILGAAKNYKRFCDFKKCLKENLCDELLHNVKRAKVYKPLFKDVILHYTMKKRWWILFFFLYKIKNI